MYVVVGNDGIGIGSPYRAFNALGSRLANQHAVVAAHIVDNRLVQLVAAVSHRSRIHDAVQREHRDFRGAAADV